MTTEDERRGRLEAKMEHVEEAMVTMQEDIAGLKRDVDGIKQTVARIEGSIGTVIKAADQRFTLFAYGLAIYAAIGLYTKSISEWLAAVLFMLAVVVLQRESVVKFARTVFRSRDRETTSVDTSTLQPPS